MMRLVPSLCLVVLTGALVATEVKVPRFEGEVRIDGRLDETVWKKAARLGPFMENDEGGEASEDTHVRLFRDGQALYLGWEVADRDIEATMQERDSRFWEEEVVEFFLTTGPLERYFELQWNPLGGVFDAVIANRLDPEGKSIGFEGDWDYTARGMESRVTVSGTISRPGDRDRFWRVEVRIPFADLDGGIPASGTRWRANFYRFNRGGGRPAEKQAWNPTRDATFHQPSAFGTLVFE